MRFSSPVGAGMPKSDFGDGIIEVIGISSSFHIAQMQFALSEPLRLGRGKLFQLSLSTSLPVQADGEPWEQGPCEIMIETCGQVPVLVNEKKDWLVILTHLNQEVSRDLSLMKAISWHFEW